MTKKLHFIWFQGWDKLPQPLWQVRERWRSLNPGYDIRSWDGPAIAQFIAKHYPSLYPFYLSLGSGEAENIRIVKKCDFSRLLLLHHYGGWYLDTDCVALRPLSSLLDSGGVHHRGTPFSYSRDSSHPTVLSPDPEPVSVNFDKYEMLLTREHLPNRKLGGYPVSNTAIYAQAGSPLLMDMIEGCVARADRKVLEFAGPTGLGAWVRERAPDLKGRLLILPPYYLLWQTHDMGTPWDRTVCCHLNRLDWTDKTKEVPWDI